MLSIQYHQEIERQRRAEARRSRPLSSAAVSRPPRRRVSRAVGRLMVDVGSRLAADPVRERARSQ